MQHDREQEAHEPERSAVDHRHRQRIYRILALAVMADLEVCVRLGVDRRRNRYALCEVGPLLFRHDGDDLLGVAARELA